MASQNTKLQQSLFPALPVPSQADVVATLEPDFPLFWDCVMGPWADFQTYRASDPNFTDLDEDNAAVWLTMQASIRARQMFDGRDGFQVVNRHGKPVIVVRQKLAVTVKKLTRRLNPKTGRRLLTRSNIDTPANSEFWGQLANGDSQNVPRVILGYELLKELSEIRLLIAYPRTRGRAMEWEYRIPAQAQPLRAFQPPSPTPTPVDEPRKGFTITSRRETVERGTGSE